MSRRRARGGDSDSDDEYDPDEEESGPEDPGEGDQEEDADEEDDDEEQDQADAEEDDDEDEDEEDEGERAPSRPTGLDTPVPDANVPVRVRVPDNERITSDYLQHTEFVGLLSTRIKQLESGAPCLVEEQELVAGVTDPRELAVLEMRCKQFPYYVTRDIHYDQRANVVYYEQWDVNQMMIPPTYLRQL